MQTFNEEQQSRREDSVCEINRLKETLGEEVILLVDKRSQLELLQEEVKAINRNVNLLDYQLFEMVRKHKDEFNETV